MFLRVIDDDLVLRLLEDQNAIDLYEVVQQNREHIRVWMTWIPADWSIAAARRLIRGAQDRFAANSGFWAGIFLEGHLCGCVILNQIDWTHHSCDIGYWLDESHQGRGLVTRSCRALVHYCLRELQLHRVEIRVAAENARSRAVPERLGFREDGVLREANRLHSRYVDLAVYSMLSHEWPPEGEART